MTARINLNWDTNGVRREERFAYFVDGICRAFTHLDPELTDPDAPFFVRINHREINDTAVTHLYSSKYVVRRSPGGIGRSSDHDFFLNYIVSGTIDAAQGDERATFAPGDVFILDNASPFKLDLRSGPAFNSRVVRIRRSAFMERRAGRLFTFDQLHADNRLMPLLKMNLAQLARARPSCGDDEIGYFGQTVTRLVELMLSERTREERLDGSGIDWSIVLTETDRNVRDAYVRPGELRH